MALDLTTVKREHDLTSEECSLTPTTIEALRDFFSAIDWVALKVSYKKAVDRCEGLLGTPFDWRQVEYEFNRLFVGPSSPIAPPYASVYMDEKPDLMGVSTLNIRSLYASIGLQVPDQGALPDDFISYELDALLVILGQQPLNFTALEYLISGHMIKWVPVFCMRCRQLDKLSQPVLTMVDLLEFTISELAQSLSGEERYSNEY